MQRYALSDLREGGTSRCQGMGLGVQDIRKARFETRMMDIASHSADISLKSLVNARVKDVDHSVMGKYGYHSKRSR